MSRIASLALKPLFTNRLVRLAIYALALLLAGGVSTYGYRAHTANLTTLGDLEAQESSLTKLHENISLLADIDASIALADTKAIDTASAKAEREAIASLLLADNPTGLVRLNALKETLAKALSDKDASDQAAAAEEAKKGTISGVIRSGDAALPDVGVTLTQNDVAITSSKTDANGAYAFRVPEGSYMLTIEASGYVTQHSQLTVTAGQNTGADASMVAPAPVPTATPKPTAKPTSTPKATPKATASPTPVPSTSATTAHSAYYATTIASPRGSFSAHIMRFDLGSGKIKVATDTASDSDCATNCPVLPIKDYVVRNGGVAGINGTYFCPADYSSCSSEVGHFFWKVLQSRTGTAINANSGLGENDPFLAFDSSGNPRLFTSWNSYKSSGFNAYAGINHKPLLVNGGSNVLNEGSLDDKQKTSKITRAALAVRGSTLFVIHIGSATIIDLADAVASLGMDYALNIDAGGSTGMYYSGSYRLGPGRSVPNALVFIEQ